MTVAIACVLVAAVMPYLFVALTGMPATGQKARWGTGYDNREPREYLAGLDGWRRRARAGEANAHEAFAPFAVAVILAQSAHAAQSWVDALAVTFVCARAAHGAFYVGDKPTLRSVSCSQALPVCWACSSWRCGAELARSPCLCNVSRAHARSDRPGETVR